ncbi:MAG: class I tRNA ligase family protein, partial [Lachnospiraceae bacterium]|nr:class I tRNA ligase family protein [Lachnospiraceae bacterium]
LWNTYAFFILYANIDDFDATKYTLEYDKLPVMDKWLLSKLNTAERETDEHLDNYRIPEAARVLDNFVDEMSNWYVRRCRERFWAKGMEQDKVNAYMTLYTALVQICKCAAPLIPFMTEEIYQNLVRSNDKNAPESIHLCDYPEANEAMIDKKLEENMEEALHIVVLGRAARNAAGMKNRQPIGRMYVKAVHSLDSYFMDIIKDELNVKEVAFKEDVSDLTSYSFKPQLKTVGPKYGKQLGGIREYLSAVDGTRAMKELKADGALKFEVNGVEISLGEEDLLIDVAQKAGLVTEADNYVTVVLDTNLSPDLIEEGFVYEVISKIQTMRKDAGFEVMDHIMVTVNGNAKIAGIVNANKEAICEKVLAEDILEDAKLASMKEWNVNGEKVTIGVEIKG